MKNPYLVANPFGVFLVRCKNMDEVREFVTSHLKKCKEAYKLLTGHDGTPSDYQVRDLREIPTIDEIDVDK